MASEESLVGRQFVVSESSSTVRKISGWTPALEQIYVLKPNVLSEYTDSLCVSTPENLTGSLIISEIKRELELIYWDGNQELPEQLQGPPFEVFQDLPCYIKSYNSSYMLPSRAENVVMKYSCGVPAGVITTGELAGFIVTMRTDPETPGVNLKRIFNDSLVANTIPYSFTNEMYDTFGVKDTETDRRAITFFDAYYRKRGSAFTWHREFVASLLKNLHIPYDPERFVYTEYDYQLSAQLGDLYRKDYYDPQEVTDFLKALAGR